METKTRGDVRPGPGMAGGAIRGRTGAGRRGVPGSGKQNRQVHPRTRVGRRRRRRIALRPLADRRIAPRPFADGPRGCALECVVDAP